MAFAATNVASVNGKNYTSYKEAWNIAQSVGSIKLLADWKTDIQLHVASGSDLTIDLNGHTIDRGLAQDEDSEGDGTVIYVEKNTVVTLKNGTIAGGCSDSGASGIHIEEESTVTLENVKVTGNRSEYWVGDGHGGGIYISNNDNCEMVHPQPIFT